MIKNLPVRLAQVGKIKIGVKGEERKSQSGSNYRLPQKIDYFIITGMAKGSDGNFIPDVALMKKLDPVNGKPRKLRIALPYDDIDLNFFTEYSFYAGTKRLCFGDGEQATRIHVDKQTKKEISRETVKCTCDLREEGKCKPHGILSVILRDNFQLGGVYQFRTTSYNSILNITSGLTQIKQMTQGILAMVPLVMSLQPQTATDKNGKQRLIYAVNIVADVEEWKSLLDIAKDIAKIRHEASVSIKQLERHVKSSMAKTRQLEADNDDDGYTDIADAEPPYTPIENEECVEEQQDINEEFSPSTLDDPPILEDREDDFNGLPFKNPANVEKEPVLARVNDDEQESLF